MEKKIDEVLPRDGARILGIRLDYMYSLIWCGKIAAVKRDGRWFIPRVAIEERKKATQGK